MSIQSLEDYGINLKDKRMLVIAFLVGRGDSADVELYAKDVYKRQRYSRAIPGENAGNIAGSGERSGFRKRRRDSVLSSILSREENPVCL